LTRTRSTPHRAPGVTCALAWTLALALAAPGCARREPPPEPAARAQALIESGNQAYRAGDYRSAARRFGAAAGVNPEDPAAYYGLGMALAKLGRDEEARAAYARARALARDAGRAPGGP
jgi:Tfp pilus assembly protein PilF